MNALLLLALAGAVFSRPLDEQWHSWKSAHGKFYAHPNEENARRQIWIENSARIEEHNAANHSFTLGLNQFADMVCVCVCPCVFICVRLYTITKIILSTTPIHI